MRVCHLLRDIRSLHKRFITWNWLIKIISMINKSRSFLTKSDLAVWANQKSNSSCPSCASCRAILINSQIGSYNNSVSSIPIWRRYPIESINKSISGSIAGVDTSCTWIRKLKPSISWFPLNNVMSTVLVDLDLSSRVSVPTSKRPTWDGWIL